MLPFRRARSRATAWVVLRTRLYSFGAGVDAVGGAPAAAAAAAEESGEERTAVGAVEEEEAEDDEEEDAAGRNDEAGGRIGVTGVCTSGTSGTVTSG